MPHLDAVLLLLHCVLVDGHDLELGDGGLHLGKPGQQVTVGVMELA